MSVITRRLSLIGLLNSAVLVLAVAVGGNATAENPAEELASGPNQVDTENGDKSGPKVKKEAVATLAGGCFWCMEPPFDKLAGVIETTSGYTGGHTETQPTNKCRLIPPDISRHWK